MKQIIAILFAAATSSCNPDITGISGKHDDVQRIVGKYVLVKDVDFCEASGVPNVKANITDTVTIEFENNVFIVGQRGVRQSLQREGSICSIPLNETDFVANYEANQSEDEEGYSV